MKLSRFEVERFGHFSKRTFSLDASQAPTVFFGENEAGKTTLLAFLRELMFGYGERSRYLFNPADEISGNASGTFANGDAFEFRRRKGRKNVVSGNVGLPPRPFGEIELTRFLGQANASLYANVFAFGLGELERGEELLKQKNMQSALYAGALGGGRNVQAIRARLDAQIDQLFNPNARSSNRPIAEAAARMKELTEEMAAASLRSHDFSRAVERALDRNSRAETLTTEVSKLRAELEHAERLLKGAPLLDSRRALAAERTELGDIDARRIVAQAEEIRALAREAPRVAEDAAKLDNAAAKNEGEREELQRAANALDPAWDLKRVLADAPSARTVSQLQDLARTRTRLEEREVSSLQAVAEAERRHEAASSVALTTATPTREIVDKRRDRRDRGIELLAKPEDLWVNKDRKAWLEKDRTPFADAVKRAVAEADEAIDALIAGASDVAVQENARTAANRAKEELDRAKAKVAETREAIATFDAQWASRAGAFAAFGPADACNLAGSLSEVAARARLTDERGTQIQIARKRIAAHAERIERLRSLLIDAPVAEGTSTISILLERLEKAERAIAIERELVRLDKQVASLAPNEEALPTLIDDLVNANLLELDARRATLQRKLADAEKTRSETLREAGVADANKASLDGNARAARLAMDLESKRAELATLIDRLGPLVIARHALGEAIVRFERDNQPSLLKSVSELLSQITGGKYVRVEQRFADSILRVVTSQGDERTFDELSTGTREQLYLSIRLAFVEDYCQKNEPLPVVMDDVFVNFDHERAKASFSALKSLLRSTQVCFFTCHESQVQIAQSVFPDLNLIRI
ncbi:MAG: AAA family ATPase [Polyangiaceae bacterium]